MTYRIEHGQQDEILVRPLAASAVDGVVATDVDSEESRPIVLVALCTMDENQRLDDAYYAMSGQDVLLLLGALRAAGSRVFGPGFAGAAGLVCAMTLSELEAWLDKGANVHALGER